MELLTKASFSPDPNQRELDNLKVAYQAACEAVVLLENDGTLPFQTKKIALYGAGAIKTIKGGTGSGEVNERHSVTVLEGLRNRGFEISSQKWLDDYETGFDAAVTADKKEKRKRLNLLKLEDIMQMLFDNFRLPAGRPITEDDFDTSNTDSCIYVLSRQAGEGGDRKAEPGDLYLTEEEETAIRFCADHYEHFVLVINCGSAIDMSFKDRIPGINAIVYICQLGTEGGNTLADIISGAVTPSGKLSDTWAKQYADIPFASEYSYLNGDLEDEFRCHNVIYRGAAVAEGPPKQPPQGCGISQHG